MELKDWLLLFIPIIFNGFLIWIFQYMFKNRTERQEKFRILREEIFKLYIEKIAQSIAACRDLYAARADATVDNDESLKTLDTALQNLKSEIRDLYYYFDTYKIVLSTNDKVNSKHTILKERFEEWILNWDDGKIQVSFFHDCEEILQSIMDEGLKYICGIK